MKWDPPKRRYVDSQGHVLSEKQVRQEVDQYISDQQEETRKQTQKLIAGTISLTAFFLFMRSAIERWHKVTGSIAYGGKARVGSTEEARIQKAIESELAYLLDFQKQARASFAASRSIANDAVQGLDVPGSLKLTLRNEIADALTTAAPSEAEAIAKQIIRQALEKEGQPLALADSVTVSGTESLMGATIEPRAAMYANAAYSTYENNVSEREADIGVTLARRICAEDEASCDECVQAATEEFISLDEVTDIGTLTCMNNCRCYYEFSYEGVEPLRIDQTVNAIFNRSEAIQ